MMKQLLRPFLMAFGFFLMYTASSQEVVYSDDFEGYGPYFYRTYSSTGLFQDNTTAVTPEIVDDPINGSSNSVLRLLRTSGGGSQNTMSFDVTDIVKCYGDDVSFDFSIDIFVPSGFEGLIRKWFYNTGTSTKQNIGTTYNNSSGGSTDDDIATGEWVTDLTTRSFTNIDDAGSIIFGIDVDPVSDGAAEILYIDNIEISTSGTNNCTEEEGILIDHDFEHGLSNWIPEDLNNNYLLSIEETEGNPANSLAFYRTNTSSEGHGIQIEIGNEMAELGPGGYDISYDVYFDNTFDRTFFALLEFDEGGSSTFFSADPSALANDTWHTHTATKTIDQATIDGASSSIRMIFRTGNADGVNDNFEQVFLDNIKVQKQIATWGGSAWSRTDGTTDAPSSGYKAIINDNYEGAGFTCYNIEVADGVELTITSGNLIITEDIVNDGTITIASGGSLLTYDGAEITGTGTITVNRNTSYSDGKYSFVSSPMQQDASITGSDLGTYVYSFDETAYSSADAGLSQWVDASSDQLVPGYGYTQAFQEEISFTGTPNTGTVSVPDLSNSDDSDSNFGWHLVGNPYAAALNIETFLSDNSLSAIYLWDDGGSDTERGDSGDYLTASVIGTVSGPNSAKDFNGYIRSCQGFMIQVPSNNYSIEFNEAQRANGFNADAGFFREVGETKLKLALDGDFYNEVLFGFREDATVGIDQLYDAGKLVGNENIAFYSLIEEDKFAIQGLPQLVGDQVLKLGYDLKEAGTYDLNIVELIGELENYEIAALYNGETYAFENGNVTLNLPAGVGSIDIQLTSNEVLNVEEEINHFQFYGNTSSIRIVTDQSISNATIVIHDVSGKLVSKFENQTLSNGQWSKEIDLNEENIYVLGVYYDGGGKTIKFSFN